MKPKRRNLARERAHPARANSHSDEIQPLPRLSEQDLLHRVERASEPLVLILDEVSDPHNLGACLRSANAAGALAVMTPKNRSASVTDTVRRVACGGAEATPVVQVTNLARAMEHLKEAGLTLIGTDDSGDRPLFEAELAGPVGLVMGAEGTGMRRLTRESCDTLVRIPMLGSVECLNVSVAAGICLFEAVRQRQNAQTSP